MTDRQTRRSQFKSDTRRYYQAEFAPPPVTLDEILNAILLDDPSEFSESAPLSDPWSDQTREVLESVAALTEIATDRVLHVLREGAFEQSPNVWLLIHGTNETLDTPVGSLVRSPASAGIPAQFERTGPRDSTRLTRALTLMQRRWRAWLRTANDGKRNRGRRYRTSILEQLESLALLAAVNTPPTAVADEIMTSEDIPAYIDASALLKNDSPGPESEKREKLTLTGVSGKSKQGGTVVFVGGQVTYSPPQNFNGTDTFTYKIQDNGTTKGTPDPKTAVGTVTVTVSAVNDAPLPVNDGPLTALTTTESVAGGFIFSSKLLTANDAAGPANESNQNLTVTSVAVLSNSHGIVSLSGPGGSITYIPPTNFNGTDEFEYTVIDNGTTAGAPSPLTAKARFALTLLAVNDAPILTDKSGTAYDTTEDVERIFTTSQLITAADKPGPAAPAGTLDTESAQSLSVQQLVVTPNTHGSLSLDHGLVTYHPDPDYNGPASFVYSIVDDGVPSQSSNLATVSFNVAADNDRPLALAGAVAGDEDARLAFTLGAVSGPSNESGQKLTYGIVRGPAHGAIEDFDPSTGMGQYFPDPDFNGQDDLVFDVTDDDTAGGAALISSTATMTFSMRPVNDSPDYILVGDPPSVVQDAGPQSVPQFATAIRPGPATAIDETSQSVAFSVSVRSVSEGLTFTSLPSIDPAGTLTYQVDRDTYGAAVIDALLVDADGATSLVQTFTIRVTVAPQPVNDLNALISALQHERDASKFAIVTAPALDHVNWGVAGAPAGALGMIPFPGDGNKYSVQLDPSGNFLLTTSQSHAALLVDGATGTTLLERSFNGHQALVTGADFSHDGTLVATGSHDRFLRVFSAATAQLIAQIPLANLGDPPRFSPHDTYLAVQQAENPILLLDPHTFEVIDRLPGLYPASPRFTADESLIAYTDLDAVRIYNLSTKQLQTIHVGIGGLYDLDIGPSSNILAVGSNTGKVALIDLRSAQVLSSFQVDSSIVSSLKFSPENELIVGSTSGQISIFEAGHPQSGSSLPLLREYHVGGAVRSLFVSPTGRTFGLSVANDAPAESQIVVFPLPKAPTDVQLASKPLPRSTDAIDADIAAARAARDYLIQIRNDALLQERRTVRTLFERLQYQSQFSSPLSLPVAADDIPANAAYVSGKGAELQARRQALDDIRTEVLALEAATVSVVTHGRAAQLRFDLNALQTRIDKEGEELQPRASRLIANLDRLNAALKSSVGDTVVRTDVVDLGDIVSSQIRDTVREQTYELLAGGGTLAVQSVRGNTGIVKLTSGMLGDDFAVTGTGRFMAIDLSRSRSVVTAIDFVADSPPGDQINVTYVRGGDTLARQTLASGTIVSYQDPQGITSVLIENVRLMMSDDARAFFEYRRSYVSPYLYSWQDPGAQFEYFTRVRPDLAPRQSQIVAEANRGDMPLPLSLRRIAVTSNVAAEQSGVARLSPASNREYAMLYAEPIAGQFIPNDYWAPPVYASARQYTRFSLLKYGGAPVINYVGFLDPQGIFRQLPADFVTTLDDGSVIVHPLGQDLRLGIATTGGQPYRASLPVGVNFDFEIQTQYGNTLTDVLPRTDAVLGIRDVKLFTVNSGGPLGWSAGNSLEYSTASPVAIGTLKVRAGFVNPGLEGQAFKTTIYSGYEGTPGWDSPVASFTYWLGPSESRRLTTLVPMNVDNQGRGFVRFIVEDLAGHLISEGGRSVPAPRPVDVGVVARDGTLGWKSLAYSTDETARLVRDAQKAKDSADVSGDAGRIAVSERQLAVAVTAYQAAVSRAQARDATFTAPDIESIRRDQRAQSSPELPASDAQQQLESLHAAAVMVASLDIGVCRLPKVTPLSDVQHRDLAAIALMKQLNMADVPDLSFHFGIQQIFAEVGDTTAETALNALGDSTKNVINDAVRAIYVKHFANWVASETRTQFALRTLEAGSDLFAMLRVNANLAFHTFAISPADFASDLFFKFGLDWAYGMTTENSKWDMIIDTAASVAVSAALLEFGVPLTLSGAITSFGINWLRHHEAYVNRPVYVVYGSTSAIMTQGLADDLMLAYRSQNRELLNNVETATLEIFWKNGGGDFDSFISYKKQVSPLFEQLKADLFRQLILKSFG